MFENVKAVSFIGCLKFCRFSSSSSFFFFLRYNRLYRGMVTEEPTALAHTVKCIEFCCTNLKLRYSYSKNLVYLYFLPPPQCIISFWCLVYFITCIQLFHGCSQLSPIVNIITVCLVSLSPPFTLSLQGL